MIKIEAFAPFIEAYPEMVAEGKYGVLVLTNGEWVATKLKRLFSLAFSSID